MLCSYKFLHHMSSYTCHRIAMLWTRTYAKRPKHNVPPWSPTPDDSLGFHQTETLEQLEEWLDVEDMKHLNDAQRIEASTQKKIAFKTIEKKFFRPTQELNLLAWAAKEQICFLSQEYPEEWTPKRLSKSFPISEEGVMKLLRSKRRLDSITKVIKHDQKVQENWRALQDVHRGKSLTKSDMVINKYMTLKKQGQLHLLSNAAGIMTLPSPDHSQIYESNDHNQNRIPGLFESMVKEYCEQKHLLELDNNPTAGIKGDRQHNIIDHNERNKMLLALASGKLGSKEYKQEDTKEEGRGTTFKSSNKMVEFGESVDYSKAFSNEVITGEYPTASKNENYTETASLPMDHADLMEGESEETSSGPQRRSNSLRRRRKSKMVPTESIVEDQIKIGMTGTSKQSTTKYLDESVNMSDIAEFHQNNKYSDKHSASMVHTDQENDQFNRKIIYDVSKDSSSDNKEAYFYDSVDGYQHPFGKIDSALEKKNNLPKYRNGPRKDAILYQDGKHFYDEDGEFLYKIP